MNRLLLYTCFAFLLAACNNAVYFDAKDFTPEGLFTSGIEGPATDAKGNIYAVNFGQQGTIGKVTPDSEASFFIQLSEGSVGNGIRFNSNGEMLIADYTGHNIFKVDMHTREICVFAHEENMNQPNDIAITKDDYLYASDPNWADSIGNIWLITPMGDAVLLEANMGTTDGIEVSPDSKRLYVNESRQLNLWVYDIADDKSITNKHLFYKFKGYGLDGMRCDAKGNLYVTRHEKGAVVILSPEGKLFKEVKVTDTKPSNITFNKNVAYVTLQDRGCFATFECDPNI
ncbi:MAG: SMP-30/gluconolactonase/LRE family protein [Prevotellaceae bacterium]|jgi:sugar lactone lactonase YvrE|nr:SMP-30/gluconolactonase/LRE family protein [Prevotellaceae bacterium]